MCLRIVGRDIDIVRNDRYRNERIKMEGYMEMQGINPHNSCMLSEHSTILATSPYIVSNNYVMEK